MSKTKQLTRTEKVSKKVPTRTYEPGETIMTPRQIEIMLFIKQYRIKNGCSPTLREIAAQSSVSRVTVFGHIEALIEKGMLQREPNKVRSLILTEQADDYCGYLNNDSNEDIDESESDDLSFEDYSNDYEAVSTSGSGGQYPMAGYIAAGCPIDALEMPDTLDLTSMFETANGTFALKVRGESMIEAHICDGDYVLIEKTNQFHNGQIVVALLDDGQATLKYLYRDKNGGYRLEGANPEFKTMYVNNVQVQGVVVGVIRSV